MVYKIYLLATPVDNWVKLSMILVNRISIISQLETQTECTSTPVNTVD